MTEHDEINHPSHYGGDNIYEAIKVIDAWELDFTLGNCVKYICRAGKKTGHTLATDLRKARWYLDHKIQLIDSGNDEQSESVVMAGGIIGTTLVGQADRIKELEAIITGDRQLTAAGLIGKGEEVRINENGQVEAVRRKHAA